MSPDRAGGPLIPRHPERLPLTDLERARAETCIDIAERMAAMFSGRFPFLHGDALSEASLALILAAAAWKESHGTPFCNYAARSIRHRLWKLLADHLQRSAREDPDHSLEHLEDPQHTAAHTVDTADAVAFALRQLPPGQAAAVKRRVLENATFAAIGDESGCGHSTAWNRHGLAIAAMRHALSA